MVDFFKLLTGEYRWRHDYHVRQCARFERMSDAALAESLEYYLKNSEPKDKGVPVYDNTLANCIIPEAIKRLRKKEANDATG